MSESPNKAQRCLHHGAGRNPFAHNVDVPNEETHSLHPTRTRWGPRQQPSQMDGFSHRRTSRDETLSVEQRQLFERRHQEEMTEKTNNSVVDGLGPDLGGLLSPGGRDTRQTHSRPGPFSGSHAAYLAGADYSFIIEEDLSEEMREMSPREAWSLHMPSSTVGVSPSYSDSRRRRISHGLYTGDALLSTSTAPDRTSMQPWPLPFAEPHDKCASSGSLIFKSNSGSMTRSRRQSERASFTAIESNLPAVSADTRGSHGTLHRRFQEELWRGEELAMSAAIQWDFAVETLESKVSMVRLCGGFLRYIIFLIAFCVYLLHGQDLESGFYLFKSVYDPVVMSEIPELRVQRYFPDILNAEQYNKFVMDVVLAQIIDTGYPTGSSMLVGAMRLRTQRVRMDSCRINRDIIPASLPAEFQECYAMLSDALEDTGNTDTPYNKESAWSYKSCKELGGVGTPGFLRTYHCGGYYFDVPLWRPTGPLSDNSSREKDIFFSHGFERVPLYDAVYHYARPRLIDAAVPFLDDVATRFVMTEIYLYNPSLQKFVSLKMFAEVGPGGLWIADYLIRTMEVWTTDSLGKTVYDACFLAVVLLCVYGFLKSLIASLREAGSLLPFLINLSNMMELAMYSLLIVSGSCRIAFITKCVTAPIGLDKILFSPTYPTVLDEIMWYRYVGVCANAVCTVLGFLRLFRYFRIVDRLNILTSTLHAGQDTILGVLLIFLLVVSAYAITGYSVFGTAVWEFRTVPESLCTLLLMLVRQINFPELAKQNYIFATFFFWSYMVLTYFILLNFLIGTLIEAFETITAEKSTTSVRLWLWHHYFSWSCQCKPYHMWKSFVNWWCGHGELDSLRDGIQQLRTYRDVKYPTPAEGSVKRTNAHVMVFEDFEAALGEKIVSQLGSLHIHFVWLDLVYEWDCSQDAMRAVKIHKEVDLTERGVRVVMGHHLALLDAFPQRLATLQKNLSHLSGSGD